MEFENEVERLVNRWIHRTVELSRQEMVKMDIGFEGDLERGLSAHYRKLADGYIETGLIFGDSGRYVDMGSGRGYSFGKSIRANFDSESTRRKSGRKKKPWIGRVVYARVNDLQGAVGFKMMERSLADVQLGLLGSVGSKKMVI